MRARHRHLNPGSAGAVLALDSRFISGLNDGDAVSTWSDRSSNGYNATASGTARPTFETNEQGGNPTIRFDGVNDTLLTGINSSVIFTGDLTYLIILKRSGSPTFPVAIGFTPGGNNAGRGIFLFSSDLYKLSYGQNAADVKSTFQVSAGTSVLGSAVKEGTTATVFANSTSVGSGSPATASVAATNFAIGSGISANFFQGDICFSAAFNSAVQSSLRRRLEHAAAFSFKIACS